MRRILFLFILLLLPVFGYTQFLPKAIQGNDLKQCEDGGFIVAGNRLLKRTDRNGNRLWYKYLSINASSLQITSDGGFIVAGSKAKKYGSSQTGFLIKTDRHGNVLWEKGYAEGKANSIQITSDGGFIVAGKIDYGTFDNSFNYLFKTDRNGNLLWEKKYSKGEANSVQITSDGGFIVATKASYSIIVKLIKTDPKGNLLWEKVYAEGKANSVQVTSDGGFIVAGVEKMSSSKYFSIWKMDPNGNLLWEKRFGDGEANSIQITSDGGFIVAGSKSGYNTLTKTDPNGNLLWEKRFGNGSGGSVQITSDGGFIVAGGNSINKFDSLGNELWQKFFNANDDIRNNSETNINALQICTDGGYVMVGSNLLRTNADGEMYESGLLDQISSYVESKINIWQVKGEFEKTNDYKQRVTQQTRNVKIDSIQTQAISYFKKQYLNELNIKNITLNAYDADNETFLIDIFPLPSVLLAVPISEAQYFKQNFKPSGFSNIDFIIKEQQFILSNIDVSAGSKKYTYDISDKNEYATATFEYNFNKIDIDILEDKDVSIAEIENKNIKVKVGISSVDVNIPENKKVANRYALIIGNQDYTSYQRTLSSEQNVDYAENDATIFKQYCLNTLGVKKENMHFLLNATAGRMSQEIDLVSKIVSKLGPDAELIVYYAGHGYPDELTKVPYLIPVDVSASNLNSAIKLSEVYEKLSSTNAGKISVFLDACFTGGGRTSGLIVSRGVKIRPKKGALSGNMIVFSASSSDQSSLPYHKEAHGMFTFHLLKKLQETKGAISMGALSDYLIDKVSLQSLKENKKEQDPSVNASQKVMNQWRGWSF